MMLRSTQRSAFGSVVAAITVIVSLLVPTGRPASAAGAVPAQRADAFVDSIGVNVHLHYNDTVYNRYDDVVKPRLRELGGRHIRDGVYTYDGASADTFYYQRLRDLGAAGIGANLITSIDTSFSERTDVSKLDDVQRWTGGAVESFEGVNEPDLNGGPVWVAQTRTLQRDLWNKVQNDAKLRAVDVVGPSPAFDPEALGDVSAWVDYGNWHPYPGGNCPTCADLYGQSFDTRVARYREPSGTKPLVLSETGYHNAVNGEHDHRPVSERAAAKYIPRLLFEHFNRGIPRSYLYELIDVRNDPVHRDREANFGLLRNDGSRKPAFIALRNLIALLEDPGPGFTPSSLAFELSGQTAKVHTTLLQKRDGTFYLALWQERSSYDTGQWATQPDAPASRGDIAVPTQRVTVTTGTPTARARLYAPGRGTSVQRTWTTTRSFAVEVPDEVVVLELTPASATPGVPTRPAPDVSEACKGISRGAFADVSFDHPFGLEVDCLFAWHVTRGAGSGRRYQPGYSVSRWQMAVFLDRVAARERRTPTAARTRYQDLGPLTPEARQAIARLTELGVVNGKTAKSFAPFQRVTRAQIAAFLHRLHTVDGDASTPQRDHFTDDEGNFHEDAINAIAETGIVQGVGNRRYRPGAATSRGQMAAMLTRFIQVDIEDGLINPADRADASASQGHQHTSDRREVAL